MAISKSRKSAPKKSKPRKRSAAPSGNVTPEKELERLARLADDCRTGSKKFSDKIGGEIKEAAKSKFLNAKAFRSVLVERRMGQDDPIKLRNYLDAQEHYREVLKIYDLKAPDMMQPKAKKEKPTEMKPVGEAATNVVNLAGAMADAIEKDKANKAEMEVA